VGSSFFGVAGLGIWDGFALVSGYSSSFISGVAIILVLYVSFDVEMCVVER
jgi:hypothetical protein